ncbi:hypothetical protein [Ensifer sp. OV372]|uniref:hypothetical protein n=1 Tax=Ensifer sp. OV372 TaxID=1855293 RepID=UPI0008F41A98|nr:hypothetical protein [Ensifer sp. OV372]SFH23171.1 hypothetical protein SAMN05216459_12117 [Ensifer sp. OV372]
MTPAESARQIDKEEFAAECAAIRQRAYDWLASQRPEKPKDMQRGFARLYEGRGEKHTLREWSEITGISMSTLNTRINLYDWSVERAVTEKIGHFGRRGKEYTINGATRSLAHWAKDAGISTHAIHERLSRGWPIEAALTLPKGSARPTSDEPGVVSDFAPSEGTGAGGTAQESPNITFSESAACPQ